MTLNRHMNWLHHPVLDNLALFLDSSLLKTLYGVAKWGRRRWSKSVFSRIVFSLKDILNVSWMMALQVNAMTTSFNKPYFVSEKSGLVRTTTPISDWMFLAEKSWLTSNFRILSKTRHVNAVFKLLYWWFNQESFMLIQDVEVIQLWVILSSGKINGTSGNSPPRPQLGTTIITHIMMKLNVELLEKTMCGRSLDQSTLYPPKPPNKEQVIPKYTADDYRSSVDCLTIVLLDNL